MVNSFHIFSRFSGLRPDLSKLDAVKILGTHFFYNKMLKEERNLCLIVANIQRVLKLWKLRNLTLEGKILIFT